MSKWLPGREKKGNRHVCIISIQSHQSENRQWLAKAAGSRCSLPLIIPEFKQTGTECVRFVTTLMIKQTNQETKCYQIIVGRWMTVSRNSTVNWLISQYICNIHIKHFKCHTVFYSINDVIFLCESSALMLHNCKGLSDLLYCTICRKIQLDECLFWMHQNFITPAEVFIRSPIIHLQTLISYKWSLGLTKNNQKRII